MGLVCTGVTALLYASSIWLTKLATEAIEKMSAASARATPEQIRQVAEGLTQLGWVCLVFLTVFSIRYFFSRGQMYYLSYAANKLSADLRVRLFEKIVRLPMSYFTQRRSGAIQSILTNDVNVYQTSVGIIRDSIDGPLKAIAATVTLFLINWQLALLAMVVIPVMGSVIQRNSRRIRDAQTQVQTQMGEVTATSQEVLQGVRVVKAFGVEEKVTGVFQEQVDRAMVWQTRAVEIFARLRPLVEVIGAFALAGMLYVGGWMASQGTLRASDIVAMAFAVDTINQGFRILAGVSNTYAGVQAAADRIYSEVLDVPEAHEAAGDQFLLAPRGEIDFENVSFRYPDGTEALSNVSFKLQPGRSLALVGPSGAGKTTIADLLLRFYDPTEGRILFDGVDLRDLNIRWLRSQIGVVPQHTFLFAGSIEENVRLGAGDASPQDLEIALRQAHATDFSMDMEARQTPVLGERGVRLSGGQMQRIAIARALIRRPTVLLLDEATSALDAESEKAVTEALEEVMRARTTLFIAHRLTTAARADEILVLSRGRVLEQGSHDTLMKANGAYAGLFRAFSGGLLS